MAIGTGTALLLGGIAGLAGNAINSNQQTNAINNATAQQTQAAQDALAVQQASESAQIERLDPYTQFGQEFIPQAQQAFADSNALFQPGAIQGIMSTDQYGSISEDTTNRLLARSAATGRSATGDTATTLQRGLLSDAQGILNSERNASLSRNQQILQALGIGQNAAAGQASVIGQSGQIQGNLLTDIGAVGAAGTMGIANANTQAIQNALGTVPFFTTAAMGTPAPAGA
jgi:hypothetical protein